MKNYSDLANQLTDLLSLSHPPIAISFHHEIPNEIPRYDSVYPSPTEDGRTGAVAAGCVFWVKATANTFATVPADHGNCSVGSLTHGLIALEEAASQADVQALCEAKWVKPEIFPDIPTVNNRPEAIVYGPLAETSVEPDVVFLRLNGKQAMQLQSAVPSIRFEGKPQCHIIAIAKEQNTPAISVGCMLSRVRTGISNSEVTCALPAKQLSSIICALENINNADRMVAEYASQDAARFG